MKEVEVQPKFKYPFMVRVWSRIFSEGKKDTHCGGTIINRNWILTAAHCLTRFGNRLVFTVGDHNVHETEENEQDLRPKTIIMHEKFR